MRPNRQESDLEYWNNARLYWQEKEEAYFLADDREGEARAAKQRFKAELCHQEAQGLIIVYSGRAKPVWA